MSGDDKPRVKKRKWLRLLLLLPVLLIIITVVLSRMPGERPGQSVLTEMFIARPPAVSVSELNFEVGRSRVFAHADGSSAAVGTLGFQVLGPDGRETLSRSLRISTPALVENNGRFLAFDIGGTALRVFDSQSVVASLETEFPIVSASINAGGWQCVAAQPQTGGARGTVDVYDSSGKRVYNIVMGTGGFVLSAILSDDNRNLAILSIAETGSRISIYSGIDEDKDYPDEIIELGDEIFLEIAYLSDLKLLAFGNKSVLVIGLDPETPTVTLCNFEDKRLGGYTYSDSFVAVHLYDYSIGYSGQIITVDFDGTILGQLETSQEVSSMASDGDTLMLLGSDGVTFYSKELAAYPLFDNSASAITSGHLVALSENMALAATDLSATVIRMEQEG